VKIAPKNWQTFQHYKDRNPTWIKLHKTLLDDFEYQSLPMASKALAPMLWLIASEHPEGVIDANPEKLAFRLRWPAPEIQDAIGPLIGKGFFVVEQFDSKPLAVPEHVASPENINKILETEKKPLLSGKPDGGRLEKQKRKDDALHVLEFLNGKARKHFRPVAANLKFIESRLAEGVTVQDLKTLTVLKCREWLGTDQEKFLRPETLYNATKCQSYLGAIPPEESCNAPDVTVPSKPPQNLAPAGGNPPSRTPQPQAPDSMRSVGDVLGSLDLSAATTRGH
jgi:uncharacterized phage protein (TIGR02220 family)